MSSLSGGTLKHLSYSEFMEMMMDESQGFGDDVEFNRDNLVDNAQHEYCQTAILLDIAKSLRKLSGRS